MWRSNAQRLMDLRAFGPLSLLGAALLWSSAGAQSPLFSDQTVAQGVSFTHTAIPDDKLRMGAGGAWGDFNGDGFLDVYVANQVGPNSLFQNMGGSGFIDVAPALGVDDPAGQGTGALWGDYDNDGDADLFVMNRGNSIMFRNDGPAPGGGWTFTDVTAAIGVAAFGRTAAAVYGDYDGDGWLDLYVANHGYYLRFPQPGDGLRSDYLFHNVAGPDGARVFVDVAPQLFPPEVLQNTMAHSVGFFDYDNDGDLDIYVVNEVMASDSTLRGNVLWRNDGPGGPAGWMFSDATAAAKLTLKSNPMGLAIGDINNDGWLDIAMTDVGPNYLFQNLGGVFTQRASQAGVQRTKIPGTTIKQIGWGLFFFDFNLDGFEDLYVGTGELSTSTLQQQPNPLFQNNRNLPSPTFTDVTDMSGANDGSKSRTVIKGDYDSDGDEDIYVVNYGQQAHLYRNDHSGGDFLTLKLRGTVSNRDAIGARVKVSVAGLPDQHRMVQSGSTTSGGNELALFFGAPGRTSVDAVEIKWPSGRQSILTSVATNQRLEVVEPVGGASSLLTVAGATVAEGNQGTTEVLALVKLSPATASDAAVDYSTFDGTATAGADYEPRAGTLTLPAGSTWGVMRVPIIGDTVDESTFENFVLRLSNPVNVTLGATEAEVWIRDDDGVLLEDSFADGVVTWTTDGGTWSESGGALVGVPSAGTTRALAPLPWSPSGDLSCSICTVEATLQTAGGLKNKVGLIGWQRDWSNYVELTMEEEANRWVVSQIAAGSMVSRKAFGQTIDPNIGYRVGLSYDGSVVKLLLNGVAVMSVPVTGALDGNVGLKATKTTGTFRNVRVY